jgi:serine/threonine protein kinase
VLGSVPKGEIIGVGGTGIVELMPNGVVIKRASTVIGLLEDNEVELFKEAAIYARLGPYPRLPKIYTYDENPAQLSMEYMCNGDLNRYLAAHNDVITGRQRLQWIVHLLEALCYIHKFENLHADLTPRNFLSDGCLELKISDFAGFAVDGCVPTGLAGTRYTTPLCTRTNFNLREEIHILGSTIYHISTGQAPYEEFDIDQLRPFTAKGCILTRHHCFWAKLYASAGAEISRRLRELLSWSRRFSGRIPTHYTRLRWIKSRFPRSLTQGTVSAAM